MRLRAFSVCTAFVIILLFAAPTLAAPASKSPTYIPCETYYTPYSGTVRDQQSVGVDGVIVKLSTYPPYQSLTYYATSLPNGAWSKSVRACPYNAKFYWKSSTNGPLVKSVSDIPPQGTVYNLNVWRVLQKVPVMYQFPNTNSPSVTISYTTTTSVKVSIDAKVTGGISAGFVGVNFAGHIGVDYTIETGYTSTGWGPWRDFYPTGRAIRVLDTTGGELIYVEQWSSANYQSETWTDQITKDQAISRMQAEGRYPYVSIAAYHQQSYVRTLTTVVEVDVEYKVWVDFFGVTASLTVSMGVAVGQSQSVTTTITNNDGYQKCYVLYDDALENHVWWHSNTACP